MDSYIKIKDGKAVELFTSDWVKNGDNLERRQGAKLIQQPLSKLQKITFTKDLASRSVSIHNYVVEGGKARLKTDEEITEEKKPEIKRQLKQERENALQNITVEVNGKIFQSRRSDEMNFRLVLASMEDRDTEEWILDDDSIVEVTKAELAQAYMLGLAEGKRIFSEYKEAIKKL